MKSIFAITLRQSKRHTPITRWAQPDFLQFLWWHSVPKQFFFLEIQFVNIILIDIVPFFMQRYELHIRF